MKTRLQTLKHSRRPRQGFSLVEVSMGMAIMGTIILALVSGFTTGFFTMQLARENQRATQIMLEKMETIRLYSWDQINDPTFIPKTFSAPYDPNAPVGERGISYNGTMTITNAPVSPGYANEMRMVIVTLNWQTGNLNRTRSFSSLISRDGLQNYVY